MNPELMLLCLVGLGCAFVLGCIYFVSRLIAQRQKRLEEEALADLEFGPMPPAGETARPIAPASQQVSAETVASDERSEDGSRAETPESAREIDEPDSFSDGVAADEADEEPARPVRRRRRRREDDDDEEELEPDFVVSKPMPLHVIREYALECAGRARFAFDEGLLIQAYYFALLAELNGNRQAADLLAHIRVVWRQFGYPEEGFTRQSGFSRVEYLLGLSALRIDAHYDAHVGYACLEDLTADGNELAEVLLQKRRRR